MTEPAPALIKRLLDPGELVGAAISENGIGSDRSKPRDERDSTARVESIVFGRATPATPKVATTAGATIRRWRPRNGRGGAGRKVAVGCIELARNAVAADVPLSIEKQRARLPTPRWVGEAAVAVAKRGNGCGRVAATGATDCRCGADCTATVGTVEGVVVGMDALVLPDAAAAAAAADAAAAAAATVATAADATTADADAP